MQYLTFKRSDRRKFFLRQGTDAVNADSQAYHVKLKLRKTFDAGRIQDMAHGHVADSIGNIIHIVTEKVYLTEGERVLRRVLRHAKVGENGFDLDLRRVFEKFHQLRQFVRHKAQAVHAGVQLDVNGIVPDAPLPQNAHQLFKGVQVGNGGLHARVNNLRIKIRSRREHQDGQRDTVATQFQALHRVGNGEIVCTGALHHGCELHTAVTVCIGLHQNQ